METARRVGWRAVVADRRLVDGALVLFCLALTALAVKTPWQSLPLPVIAVSGVLGSLAQWRRRRWPGVAAAAGAAAFALSGNFGPLLAGLYAGAVYGPRRRVWACGAVAWAGGVGWSWIDAGRPPWSDAVYWAVAIGLITVVAAYLATRKELLAALRDRAERAEADRLLRDERARAAERTRIAREMHDVLAHKVSLIALYAGALELHAGGSARLQQGTALIRVTAREALHELRTVLGVLHADPGAGEQASPAPFADLASLVRDSTDAGQPVELRDSAGPVPPATARVVYRTVQEGLTNARKHAPGAPTTVSVNRGGDGSVTVVVRNNAGTAAPLDLPGSGVGLIGLAERIRLVGGALHSGPPGGDGGAGWELRAVVPWLDQHTEHGEEVDVP